MVIIHASVGKDQDIGSVSVCTVRLNKETIYGFLKTGILIINNRNGFYLKSVYFHIADFHQVCVGQNRIVDPKYFTVLRLFL